MAFDDSLIVDHLLKTHSTELLSEREKHLIGLAVTMTRGMYSKPGGKSARHWDHQRRTQCRDRGRFRGQ